MVVFDDNNYFCALHSAVFVPGYDVETTYTSLLGLHRCKQRIRERVTVHLVYPLSHPPAQNSLRPYLEQALSRHGSCDEFITRLDNNDLTGKLSWNYANVKVNVKFSHNNINTSEFYKISVQVVNLFRPLQSIPVFQYLLNV